MKTNKKSKGTGTAKDAAQVKVWQWWAPQITHFCDDGNDNTVTKEVIVIRFNDGSHGLLDVNLKRAFDGSEDWCVLDAIIEGKHVRYTAPQVELPKGLRSHIAFAALAEEASSLSETVDQELIMDAPCYGTYLDAETVRSGKINAGCLESFENSISDPESVGCTEESDVLNMKRLVKECRKYMPNNRDDMISQETHGFGD